MKMNHDSLVELLSEGMHTAFRKATSCPQGMKIHRLIDEMPDEEWAAVVEFVAAPLDE
jgi:hypothetical protein